MNAINKLITVATQQLDQSATQDGLANATTIADARRTAAVLPLLADAAQNALEWIKETQPHEHGDPHLGAVWGKLEHALEKLES